MLVVIIAIRRWNFLNNIKKFIFIVFSFAIIFSFSGCTKTLYSEEEIIASARGVIPLSDIKNIDMRIAGKTIVEDKALMWFVTGNEYQNNRYFPIEYNVVGKDKYKMYHLYKNSMGMAEGIAFVQWNIDYHNIIIENPECKILRVKNLDGIKDYEVTEDNNVFNIKITDGTTEYLFIDKDGNEL